MAPKLRKLLKTLPQELYDQIYDEVFTGDTGLVLVRKKYKLPSVLQVNRATRSKLLNAYLSKSIFVAESQKDLCVIHSMPLHLLNQIKDIRTAMAGNRLDGDELLADYYLGRASYRWRKVFDAAVMYRDRRALWRYV